jgi:hypothetical protein
MVDAMVVLGVILAFLFRRRGWIWRGKEQGK